MPASAEEPAAPTASAEPPAPHVAATSVPKPHRVATAHAAAHTTKKATSHSTKGKESGCDSPFYVDPQGIKHIRPECM